MKLYSVFMDEKEEYRFYEGDLSDEQDINSEKGWFLGMAEMEFPIEYPLALTNGRLITKLNNN